MPISPLLQQISDVLDISKIQAGKLRLFIEHDVDLYAEIDAAVSAVRPQLQNKPVEFVLDVDDNLPRVSGDRRRIRQILLDLLSNAVKFTAAGTITFSAKARPGNVTFAVIDSGPGIASEAQEIIFEPFVQVPGSIKQVDGTRLGLPISRNLARAHGGRLWVDSTPGEGSVFYFVLPCAAGPAKTGA